MIVVDMSKVKGNIKYIFPFGSSVYGTKTEQSDEDYIVVIEGNKPYKNTIENEEGHIHVYSDITFRKLIEKHDIAAMESIFLQETEYEFNLDLETLRSSISAVVSNSFSKARKKMRKDENYDIYGAKKSLFHSLRILEFGIQIAKHGKIIDYGSMNEHLFSIMAMDSEEFNDYREIYEPIGKELKKEFKRVAPLNKDARKTKEGW